MIQSCSALADYEPHDKDNNKPWSGWHLTLWLTQIQKSTLLFDGTAEQLAASSLDKTLTSTHCAPVHFLPFWPLHGSRSLPAQGFICSFRTLIKTTTKKTIKSSNLLSPSPTALKQLLQCVWCSNKVFFFYLCQFYCDVKSWPTLEQMGVMDLISCRVRYCNSWSLFQGCQTTKLAATLKRFLNMKQIIL